MADTKISDLTDGAPLVDTDLLVVARGSDNRKISAIANLLRTTAFTGTTASIEAAAYLGIDQVDWTPSSTPTLAFVTTRMRKIKVNIGTAGITGLSHPVGGYDYMEVEGNTNTLDLAFVHESKFKKSGTGTVNNLSFYKPAIDTIAGAVTNLTLYDGDMDLTGVSVTNAYLLRTNRSNLAIETAGRVIGATGNEIPTTYIPPIATGRYYFPQRWGSAGTGAPSRNIAIATPPIMIPNRTTFNRIGVEVTTGVASTVIRLGVYKMGADGLPGDRVYDAGTVSSATSGVKEITGNFTLEAGAYFLVYQATGGSADPTVRTLNYTDYDIIQLYGNDSANPAGATVEDWLYIANTGALPTPFGTVTRLRVGGALPAVFIRRV